MTNTLEHFGVKGQKWGVRKDKGHEGERVKTKQLAKLDAKWENSVYSSAGAVRVHNAMADKMNNGALEKFNSGFKGKKVNGDSELTPKYLKAYEDLVSKTYSEVVPQVHGVNPSGTKRAVFKFADSDGPDRIVLEDISVSHADNEDVPTLTFIVKRDADGFITEVNTASLVAKHDDTTKFMDGFLSEGISHFGVKGQKWGVRKDKRGASSSDASRHASNRKKSVNELSDAELRDLVGRINMEQQFSRMNPGKVQRGNDKAKTILAVGATANAAIAFAKSPAGKAIGSGLADAASRSLNIPVSSIGTTL